MPNADHSGTEDFPQDPPYGPRDEGSDGLGQLRILLEGQSRHLDRMRGAIARVGRALADLESGAQGDASRIDLLKAQAEAIQGLTLLALKGQHVQATIVATLEALADTPPPARHPRDFYPLIGLAILLSVLAFLF